FAPVEHAQEVRQKPIPRIGQFIQGKLPIGFARTAAYEGQLAVARSARIPFQEILDLRRLTVFVNAKDANIEIEPGILEIVWVAAIKGHLLFRREDDSHIIIAFVTIKMIRAALIKCHY